MNTTSLGQAAEAAVADKLAADGFKVLERNWRRPVCEIDIIASRDNIVYFVEVKFRTTSGQGTGLDYITPKKLKQMQFAADMWCSENNWTGDYRLLAAEVDASSSNPMVKQIIEI